MDDTREMSNNTLSAKSINSIRPSELIEQKGTMSESKSEIEESKPVEESNFVKETSIIRTTELNVANHTILKKLISHIETNILGKLPEVIRLYSHYELIFDIINQQGNISGQKCLDAISVELDQLSTVFNIDYSKLQKIILTKDRRQYDNLVISTMSKKQRVESFKSHLEILLADMKRCFVRSVEHTLKPKEITRFNFNYSSKLKMLNGYINDIKHVCPSIDWIIETNEKTTHSKHKDYMCASSVFKISSEEYKELVEDSALIIVHKPTRRYKCCVNKHSLETYVSKCFETAFPKIESESVVKLYATCPSTKTCGTVCGSIVCIDDLVSIHGLESVFKLRLMEKKKEIIKSTYGVDIFIRCPKPDCPNGDGFPVSEMLSDLMNGSISSHVSPIHRCGICNSVWCSKCGKAHPGRLCADEDDEHLGPDAKKCPSCKLPTTRDGGCFHMTCIRCSVHWCWDCNHFTPQSNAYAHKCIKGNWVEDNQGSEKEQKEDP
jgi:hypothetical protein